jgi:hypothetical protein
VAGRASFGLDASAALQSRTQSNRDRLEKRKCHWHHLVTWSKEELFQEAQNLMNAAGSDIKIGFSYLLKATILMFCREKIAEISRLFYSGH